jgi:lipid II:glycine glycyltransferase (peptidoglycan interpeptide bridge formation enzyme)
VTAENLISLPGIFPIGEASPPSRAAVQWVNPLEHSDWDAQIKNHPATNFFHSAAWANVLAETYNFRPVYFVAKSAGAVQSLLPLMEIESRLTGHRGVALPFTDDCEPVCADQNAFKKLFLNAAEIGRLRGWDYLEIRGGQKFFNSAPPSVSFYSHNLDLPADENNFFCELKSPVRRAIRKAEKEGVRVEISQELSAVKSFYSLQCKARKKHGLPPQPFSFFKNIHKHVLAENHGIVVLARRKKTPVAGAIFFQFGDRAIYKFGASNETFQHLRGNNLVMWEAIRHFSRAGLKKLNLGRTSLDNDGLRRFKLGWNAT